jgi:hypothetical protein
MELDAQWNQRRAKQQSKCSLLPCSARLRSTNGSTGQKPEYVDYEEILSTQHPSLTSPSVVIPDSIRNPVPLNVGAWAEQIARAFGIHPAVIMFPEYEAEEIRKIA